MVLVSRVVRDTPKLISHSVTDSLPTANPVTASPPPALQALAPN